MHHSFSKEENDWITNLTNGEEFTCRVKVLQLDKLYNRVVFGKVFENDEFEPAKSIPPLRLAQKKLKMFPQ